jgi:hypothetical protein
LRAPISSSPNLRMPLLASTTNRPFLQSEFTEPCERLRDGIFSCARHQPAPAACAPRTCPGDPEPSLAGAL